MTADAQLALPIFSDDDLRSISGFDDARELVRSSGIPTAKASDFGNGFSVVTDKIRYVGMPLIILSWRFSEGEFGEMVSLMVVTETGEKVIINDGSTGICAQLREITNRGFSGAMWCEKGLRVSNYSYDDGKGAPRQASTFYIAF